MKITQDEIVDSQTTLHIELEDADLAPYLDMGYRRIADRVSIPGFRRGKAPRRIVEQALGRDQLLSEVLDNMAYESAGKAIAQSELDAVGHPKIERLDMQGAAVLITAIVPLQPEVRLGDYRSTRIDFAVNDVADEHVDAQLTRIQESFGTWETVERAAEFGDLATIKMKGYVEGGQEGDLWDIGMPQSMYLAEDGARPLPGFPAQIVGAEEGAHLEFTLTVPDDFPMPGSTGKPAHFTVDVLEVMERSLPELNDEFAQGLPDGFESLDALRTEIRNALERAENERANADYRERVLTALAEGAELKLPPVLVEREADHILSEQFGVLENNNVRREDYFASLGVTEDEFREEAESEAERRVTRSMTLNRVAEIEDVEPTEAEISERFNLIYAGARLNRRERRNARADVARNLKLEQTVSALVSIAKGEDDNGGESESENGEDGKGADGGESSL